VQEVFLRAWRRANSFDPAVVSLRVWLFAIARNVVVDETRRVAVRPWRRTLTGETESAVSAHSTDAPDQSVVDSWLVEEALRRIGPEHRVAIAIAIAQNAGISVSAFLRHSAGLAVDLAPMSDGDHEDEQLLIANLVADP